MSRLRIAVLFGLLLSLGSTGALADGTLDATFDADGKVFTSFSSEGGDEAHAVVIQDDGRIVAVGQTWGSGNGDFAVARYDTDGSLDTTFDSDGKVTTAFGASGDMAYAVAMQADYKIVAVGKSWNGSDFDFALARYNTDGSLDTTFDADGKVTTPIGAGADVARGVAVDSDGKIVVGGYYEDDSYRLHFALARYNTDGSLDTTFDSDGKVTTPIGPSDRVAAVAIQANDKIVAAGYYEDDDYNFHVALVRYNTDGSLDTNFDSDGKVTTSIRASGGASAMAIDSAGKIVVAGAARKSYGSSHFAVARYNSDGSLDVTFSGDGKVITPMSDSFDGASAVAIDADGKIVVAGTVYYEEWVWDHDFALARYNSDGSLDANLSGDGRLVTSSGDDYAYAVAIQADGRIVAAGSSQGDITRFALVRYNVGQASTYLSIKTPGEVRVGAKAVIKGTLTSSDTGCMNSQPVSLKKGSATVGTKTTSATGDYRFVLEIKKKTIVQATYAGTSSCDPSSSPKKTIKVA